MAIPQTGAQAFAMEGAVRLHPWGRAPRACLGSVATVVVGSASAGILGFRRSNRVQQGTHGMWEGWIWDLEVRFGVGGFRT